MRICRLGLSADVRVADCNDVKEWWDGRAFDAILADVPCSASGVVRRHPDIKKLRRESDIRSFARTQAAILDALWPLLRRQAVSSCTRPVPYSRKTRADRCLPCSAANVRRLSEEQLLPRPNTTVFIMRYCANLLRSLIWILLLAVPGAQAAVSLRNPQINVGEEGYTISADFNINFNSRLEAAVNKGIVLYFTVDFELSRFALVLAMTLIRRLKAVRVIVHHALTRQEARLCWGMGWLQRGGAGDGHQLHNWQVIEEKAGIKPDQTYLTGCACDSI